MGVTQPTNRAFASRQARTGMTHKFVRRDREETSRGMVSVKSLPLNTLKEQTSTKSGEHPDHFVTQNTCLTLRAQHTTKQLFVSSCIQHDGSLQYQPGGKQCASGMGSSTSMWHLIPVCSAICFHDANRNQRHQRCLGPRFQVYLLVPTR